MMLSGGDAQPKPGSSLWHAWGRHIPVLGVTPGLPLSSSWAGSIPLPQSCPRSVAASDDHHETGP